jgi:two-component system, OmpR family, KDP operon response regulator KdpE
MITGMGAQILVCDANPQVQRALQVTLRDAGYKVRCTATGQAALDRAVRRRPDAVILELLLPDMDGIELCRRLRERDDMPIIVLSSVDDQQAKIDAFESGADDYVTKPFGPGELAARLAARLRAAPSGLKFEADGLLIDITGQRVVVGDEDVHLTATEFALLRVLSTSRGTVTYRTLAAKVWGRRGVAPVPRIRTHIANLRTKLDPGKRRNLIVTEVGVGYRFTGRSHRAQQARPRVASAS